MKSRHYPVATFFGLVVLTLLPLSLLLIPGRTEGDSANLSAIDKNASPSTESFPDRNAAPRGAATDSSAVRIAAQPETRIPNVTTHASAETPHETFDPGFTFAGNDIPGDTKPFQSPDQPATASLPELTDLPGLESGIPGFLSPAEIGTGDTKQTVKPGVPPPQELASSDQTNSPPAQSRNTSHIRKEAMAQDSASFESAVREAIKNADNASGQNGGQQMVSRSPSIGKTNTPPATTARTKSRRSRSGRRTKTKTEETKTPTAPAAQAAVNPANNFVPVLLHSPSEQRPVRRVEDVVAQTNAGGFPIALVQSDLPDSDWWVQQMVGIRGNAFSARVNFGNETSIGGSRYKLVIVFLETLDEVRRFRIAKRFREVPDGLPRTREFTFVRK